MLDYIALRARLHHNLQGGRTVLPEPGGGEERAMAEAAAAAATAADAADPAVLFEGHRSTHPHVLRAAQREQAERAQQLAEQQQRVRRDDRKRARSTARLPLNPTEDMYVSHAAATAATCYMFCVFVCSFLCCCLLVFTCSVAVKRGCVMQRLRAQSGDDHGLEAADRAYRDAMINRW